MMVFTLVELMKRPVSWKVPTAPLAGSFSWLGKGWPMVAHCVVGVAGSAADVTVLMPVQGLNSLKTALVAVLLRLPRAPVTVMRPVYWGVTMVGLPAGPNCMGQLYRPTNVPSPHRRHPGTGSAHGV